MNLRQPACGLLVALAAAACCLQAPASFANTTQSAEIKARTDGAARRSAAKPPAASPKDASANAAAGRGSKPVDAVLASAMERPGYVHYFLLTLPDESLETLVGIEMPGRKIAWSFPDLGVVVAPFVDRGVVRAGGRDYNVSHLYGLRPFPDAAAMSELNRQLDGRVQRWVAPGTPYCDADGPRSSCMSCLGFVLRVLFPGRRSDFPDLPGDFRRALYEKSYSTEDLLLYLTGMLDLPDRDARLKRVAQLNLPDALREDVHELVLAMDAAGLPAPATASSSATQKSPANQPAAVSTRPAQRKRL